MEEKITASMLSAIALAMVPNSSLGAFSKHEPSAHDLEAERKRKEAKEKRLKKLKVERGMKQFFIEGVEVWALNRKNAERKATKILSQTPPELLK